MSLLWGQHQKTTNGICFITCLDAVAFVCRYVYVCAYVWVRGCAIYVHFQLHLNDVKYRSIFKDYSAMSSLNRIHVFVGVPLTQNISPLEMEWSKGVYYHAYFVTFTWTILVYSFTGSPYVIVRELRWNICRQHRFVCSLCERLAKTCRHKSHK